MPSIQGNVGQQNNGDGAFVTARYGKQGEQMTSQLHAQFYEQTMRGNVFSNGNLALQALTANTITLTATTTPILGVHNPFGSGVLAVISRAALSAGINNTASVGPGAFVWATSENNAAISTGSTPFPRLIGGAASKCRGMAFVPLTGLQNNLVVREATAFPSPNVITTTVVPTTVTTPMVTAEVDVYGSIIVPPGGVLALLNTVSTITISAYGLLVWEEVPV